MPSRNRKKKGKKGGKKAARITAAPADPPPGDTAHENESRHSEPPAVTDAAASAPDSAGSGGGKASWREEKDRRLVVRGMHRVPPSDPLRAVPLVNLSERLRLNVIGPDGDSVVKGNYSILRCKRAKDAYAIVKQNERRWNKMMASVLTFCDDNHLGECETSASCLLDDFDRALSHLLSSDDEAEKLIVIHADQISCRYYRCNARFRLGKYQGTIDDVNEGLALLEAWDGDANEGDRLSGDMLPVFLYNRGASLVELGDLREAVVDLRASCALYRLRDDRKNLDERSKRIRDKCTKRLLKVKTLQKIQSSAPRPHFTTKEADKIQKELGIGIFSEKNYYCHGCGVEASDIVQLFCCGGCEQVWLCGEKCQEEVWYEGHEQVCRPRSFQMGIEAKKDTEEDIEKNGGCSVVEFEDRDHVICCVICCDEDTGLLFDSLSNEVVIIDSSHSSDDDSFS